ncbi:hypothetical protein TNCV_2519451 [Trichonephila clavipes]|nr:hypothetical protein TNCV_2519451 [Trichonephila clavipes]
MEIALIKFFFCTVEEAEARCPQGIRLFNTNYSVNEYNNRRCIDVAFLGVWTAKQSSIPYQDKSSTRGMAKVVLYVLLSGMMTIGWTIGSGRRGFCALSGWWFFKSFCLG